MVSHDRLYWPLTSNGEYNSKSVYIWLMSQQTPSANKQEIKLWKILWALRIPTHWKVLLWKAYHNALPVGQNRRLRRLGHSFTCPLCENFEVLTQHLFRDCELSKLLWWASSLAIKVDMNPSIPWTQWICDWILMLHNSQAANHVGVEIFVTIVWSIWTFRNQVIHKVVHPTPLMMVDILQTNLTTLSFVTTR